MDFVANLVKRYGLRIEDAEIIVNKAKAIYYGATYPCEPFLTEETRPIVGFFEVNWVLMACDELVERLGFNSATGYKENGVSFTLDGAEVSDRLMGMLKPTVGVL